MTFQDYEWKLWQNKGLLNKSTKMYINTFVYLGDVWKIQTMYAEGETSKLWLSLKKVYFNIFPLWGDLGKPQSPATSSTGCNLSMYSFVIWYCDLIKNQWFWLALFIEILAKVQRVKKYTQIKYLFKPKQILSVKNLRLSFEELKIENIFWI